MFTSELAKLFRVCYLNIQHRSNNKETNYNRTCNERSWHVQEERDGGVKGEMKKKHVGHVGSITSMVEVWLINS